ncbi:DUF4123 domain-containing protein [Pyxidicoccus sp. 3LFB2]
MSSQEKVLAAMRAESEPLFAVLDAAREKRVLKLLQEAGEVYASLYEGPEGVELAEVAPYLVRLPGDSELLGTLVREGWGKSWGVFLTSPLPFKETRRHLRKFLKVLDGSSGEQLYFRFYDPRVLRAFLPTCTPAERTEFTGPLGGFLLEGRKGELLRFKAAPPTG